MLQINISQVNNGFIVTVSKHEKQKTNPIDFAAVMKDVAKTMVKGMNEDELLANLQNKEKENQFFGDHVFKTMPEVIAFLQALEESEKSF